MEQFYDFTKETPLTATEIAEIRNEASADLRRRGRNASIACALFVLMIGLVTLFLEGFPLHRYWDSFGKYFLLLTMGMLPVVTIFVGWLWSAWVYRRDVEKNLEVDR